MDLKLGLPPPVNLFYINFILRPATEPRRVEETFFPYLEEHDFFFSEQEEGKARKGDIRERLMPLNTWKSYYSKF